MPNTNKGLSNLLDTLKFGLQLLHQRPRHTGKRIFKCELDIKLTLFQLAAGQHTTAAQITLTVRVIVLRKNGYDAVAGEAVEAQI